MYNWVMTRTTYTVETVEQAIAIVGGDPELVSLVIADLLSQNIFTKSIETQADLEDIEREHDLDYLVIFDGAKSNDLKSTARLISVGHLASPSVKNISYSDYVSPTSLYSPLIAGWLKDIVRSHTIVLPGDGVGELSLLGLPDLAHMLSRAILNPVATRGAEFKLGNPTPISPLNLAYLIRTALPYKLSLRFDPDLPESLPSFDTNIYQDALSQLKYSLQDDPEDFLRTYLSTLKKLPVSPPAKVVTVAKQPLTKLTPLKTPQPIFIPLQTRKAKKPFSLKLTLPKRRPKSDAPPKLKNIIGRGLFIALALYFGTLAFSATVTLLSLRNTFVTLRQGDMPAPTLLTRFTLTYIQANWVALTLLPGVSNSRFVQDTTLLLGAYSQAVDAFSTASQLDKTASDLTNYVFGSGNLDAAKTISSARLQAEQLYQELSLLDGSLPDDPPSFIPSKYIYLYQEGKTSLTTLKRTVTTTRGFLAAAPEALGLGARRKYGVLFQNNLELRATGGFIGSFAILSFENGKLYDMPVFDVYDVDGQLKGHVDPPKPIKDILGEANWYLRDSNFDPDFPTSARRAEWFIKKTMNIDLNGTLALDINSLSSLLEALGPLEVADYNETVTASNLVERTQFHAEGNFFVGSTKKKEFLSTVASAIFTRLPSLQAGEGTKLLEGFVQTIKSKNALLSSTNASTERIFSTLGWNGEILDLPCPSIDSCHKDYAMVVDSNFGVNKANYFLKRSIEEIITFDQSLAPTHVLRLAYTNTALSSAWPAGIYKNYARLYLPIGATVSSVKLDGQELATSTYSIMQEHDKLVLAYFFSVPVSGKSLVEITYTSPQLSMGNELFYTWYWQKQPGSGSDDPLTVYLNYPSYLMPTLISPRSDVTPNQLKFDLVNDADRRVTVKLSK